MKEASILYKLKIVQKVSTKEAQDYLTKEHPDLKKADAHQFRIITDCQRFGKKKMIMIFFSH